MGYHWIRLDKSVLVAGPKALQTEFSIHHRLENCEVVELSKEEEAIGFNISCWFALQKKETKKLLKEENIPSWFAH